nr:MAG TPA: hypothetical protein [Caudoviricetes sp.]DAH81365.1 MAG TPA: hypothetical protein [Caudoviricetes sp.]
MICSGLFIHYLSFPFICRGNLKSKVYGKQLFGLLVMCKGLYQNLDERETLLLSCDTHVLSNKKATQSSGLTG